MNFRCFAQNDKWNPIYYLLLKVKNGNDTFRITIIIVNLKSFVEILFSVVSCVMRIHEKQLNLNL